MAGAFKVLQRSMKLCNLSRILYLSLLCLFLFVQKGCPQPLEKWFFKEQKTTLIAYEDFSVIQYRPTVITYTTDEKLQKRNDEYLEAVKLKIQAEKDKINFEYQEKKKEEENELRKKKEEEEKKEKKEKEEKEEKEEKQKKSKAELAKGQIKNPKTALEKTKAKANPPRIVAGISTEKVPFYKSLIQLKDQGLSSQTAKKEKDYYEEKYQISKYKELPFCIVIPSFKNVAKDRYLKNIRSILQQDYSNYRIIFIDDGSDDGTGEKMIEYAKKHQISQEKLTIKINEKQQMAMPNLYWSAKQFCKPYEIYIIADGDDEILGKQVFKFYNSVYQKKDLWLMYTNFISERGSVGYSRPYNEQTRKKSGYRRAGFMISHLRSFYTKLFTLIKEEDLKDKDGNWYRAGNDVAMYIPILEMCGLKAEYVPEACYLYNPSTGLNNHKLRLKEQKGNDRAIRTKPVYQQMTELFTDEEKKELQEAIGRVIPIKDLSLPKIDNVELEGWEKE